jgi:type IV pilus assembly protein PilP
MTTAIVLAAWTALAAAQGPAAPPASPAAAPAGPAPAALATAPAAAAPATPEAATADGYAYNPEGRRDPFVSLVRSGSDSRAPRNAGAAIDGLSGLSVEDISVRGVVAGRTGFVAMVQGPDNKTYLVRQNDKLLDGTVKAVNAQGLLVLQDVNDPLSLVKQKEVRKMLRGLEEGK